MGVGADMFGGGGQKAQEVEQRPCVGAKSAGGMIFQTGLRKCSRSSAVEKCHFGIVNT